MLHLSIEKLPCENNLYYWQFAFLEKMDIWALFR